MKTTYKIRPEQAVYLIELDDVAQKALEARDLAIKASLLGLIDGKAVVQRIDPDGTVHVMVPDTEERKAAPRRKKRAK